MAMMAEPQSNTLPPPQSSLSFTQGLLVGQLSVVLLIGAFIKFFIFGEAPPSSSRGIPQRTTSRKRAYSINNSLLKDSGPRTVKEKPSSSNVLRPVPSSATNTRSILQKTYYNAIPNLSKHGRPRFHHSSHQPESLDWFNVLIAQTLAQYRQTAYILKDSPTSSILDSLTETLNNPEKKPSFIDKITITDISLGEEFPIFSNCRVIAIEDPNSDGGRLQALMDVDLSDDNLSLAIETSLILNYPKPYSAVLPVALAISVVRFSGTLCISFVPRAAETSADTLSPSLSPDSTTPDQNASGRSNTSPESDNTKPEDATSSKTGIPKTSLAFSFLPDYRLDLSVRSLIGSRSRLQDVPKVAQLVEARVRSWFEERVVEPRVQVVALPGIWPRMGRTGVRAQEETEDSGAGPSALPTRSGFGSLDANVGGIRNTGDADVDGVRYRRNNTSSDGIANAGYTRQNRSGSRLDTHGEDPYRIPGSLPEMTPVTR